MSEINPAESTRAIPKQLAVGVLVFFGVIAIVAVAVTRLLPHRPVPSVERASDSPDVRIAPVGRVEIAVAAPVADVPPVSAAAAEPAPVIPAASSPAAPPVPAVAAKPAAATVAPAAPAAADSKTDSKPGKSGEQVYSATCSVCHASGVAGAPKLGDRAAWAPRLASGLAALARVAVSGKGAMPARGGNAGLSDQEVLRAVVYMANQSGGTFKEPVAAPAATPPVAAASAKLADEKPASAAATRATSPAAESAVRSEPAAPGKAVYLKTCAACHAAGTAGAPKLGDIAAWGPRIASGADAMLASVLKGKGAMPARGGNPKLSDAEVRSALEYMLGQFK